MALANAVGFRLSGQFATQRPQWMQAVGSARWASLRLSTRMAFVALRIGSSIECAVLPIIGPP